MPDQQRFSFISVSSDESDDVVIHAGASADAADEPGSSKPRASENSSAPLGRQAADRRAAENASSDAAELENTGSVERDGVDADAYRPTTLEDLEVKTPVVQRVVIAVALLLIVAVVVYEIAFA